MVSDEDFNNAFRLEKNEATAIDVAKLGQLIAEELAGRIPQATRRSKSGNLTISIPLKLDGSLLTKVNLHESDKPVHRMSEAEKRSRLLKDLGL
ncbi:MAG: hypothetical protein ACFFDH_13525 [Promethearchaeota archaeon]